MRKREEQHLQQTVARLLDVILPPEVKWTAIGHGGGGEVRGAILKSMGLKPGWPDIIVTYADDDFIPHMLGLELKSKGGKPSKEQREVHEGLLRCGWSIMICHSIEDVTQALTLAGVPHRRVSTRSKS